MAKQKIAIVEDDVDQRNNYKDAIEKQGYETAAYSSKEEALQGFEQSLPDLAILDIVLGNEVDAGFDLCRDLLFKSPTLPIIFLTERIGEIDKISGLRLGAWDYLAKPISLNYLAVRISSLLRIHQTSGQKHSNLLGIGANAVYVGDLILDQDALIVLWKDQSVNLSGTEFRMLSNLVRAPGRVVDYTSLMDATMESLITHNTINTHMHNIRKKIRKLDPDFNCIKSEYGYGYRWAVA